MIGHFTQGNHMIILTPPFSKTAIPNSFFFFFTRARKAGVLKFLYLNHTLTKARMTTTC